MFSKFFSKFLIFNYTPKENSDIELREELKLHISRRFYKNLKSKNTIFFVNGKEMELYKKINLNDVITFEYNKTIDSWI